MFCQGQVKNGSGSGPIRIRPGAWPGKR